MSLKNRILETADGRFVPQFKPGWFSFWRSYARDADKSQFMFVASMSEGDPAAAASFATEDDARAFVARVMENADRYWQRGDAAQRRQQEGYNVKRRIDVR